MAGKSGDDSKDSKLGNREHFDSFDRLQKVDQKDLNVDKLKATENYPKIYTAAPDIEIILSIASSEGLYSSKNRSTLYLDSRALISSFDKILPLTKSRYFK